MFNWQFFVRQQMIQSYIRQIYYKCNERFALRRVHVERNECTRERKKERKDSHNRVTRERKKTKINRVYNCCREVLYSGLKNGAR